MDFYKANTSKSGNNSDCVASPRSLGFQTPGLGSFHSRIGKYVLRLIQPRMVVFT